MRGFLIKFMLFTAILVGVGLYRLNELDKIPVKVENHSTVNLVEIYILGLVMSALAYPIYPEIAVEHLSLIKKKKLIEIVIFSCNLGWRFGRSKTIRA